MYPVGYLGDDDDELVSYLSRLLVWVNLRNILLSLNAKYTYFVLRRIPKDVSEPPLCKSTFLFCLPNKVRKLLQEIGIGIQINVPEIIAIWKAYCFIPQLIWDAASPYKTHPSPSFPPSHIFEPPLTKITKTRLISLLQTYSSPPYHVIPWLTSSSSRYFFSSEVSQHKSTTHSKSSAPSAPQSAEKYVVQQPSSSPPNSSAPIPPSVSAAPSVITSHTANAVPLEWPIPKVSAVQKVNTTLTASVAH